MSRATALVTPDWLEPRLGDDGIVVIEVDEETNAYDVDHIAGAIALNWRTELQHPHSRDVIDRVGFEKLLSDKGVATDDTVVLYGGNNNWFAATRTGTSSSTAIPTSSCSTAAARPGSCRADPWSPTR